MLTFIQLINSRFLQNKLQLIPEQSRTISQLQILPKLKQKVQIFSNISINQMIDWEGLLKFSLQYSDGTKSSQFKQMSEEDKKWLEQAMKHYCNSQIQRIKTILQELSKPQDSSNEQYRLNLLEEMQQILDSLDKGNTLYKMNGHIVLLRIIFFSKYQSNKIVALQIFSSINQNDAFVQTQSINSGALELVEVILKQQSIRLRQNIFTAISAMLRGQNLQAKRIFFRLDGFNLLKKLYDDEKINSQRLKNKIYILIRDLLYYDDRLHFTYNDLSSFSNTSNIVLNQEKQKQKIDTLTYDKNKQVINNELEENKKYRGCVKKWFDQEQNKKLKTQYLSWLKEQQEAEN